MEPNMRSERNIITEIANITLSITKKYVHNNKQQH